MRRMFMFLFLATLSGTSALQWASFGTFPNGTQVTACVGDNVTLPWMFTTSTSESVQSLEWYKSISGHNDTPLASYVFNMFFVSFTGGRRLVFEPNAGIMLPEVELSDAGKYTVGITLRNEIHVFSQFASLRVSEAPVTLDDKLHSFVLPESVFDIKTGEWHTRLGCGEFISLGHPTVSVIWKTPSLKIVPSTSYKNGTFFLMLLNPLEEGKYSCQLSSSPAKDCLHSDSPLKSETAVAVHGAHTRLSQLEGRLEALQEEASNVSGRMDVVVNSIKTLGEETSHNTTDSLRELRTQHDNVTIFMNELQIKMENLASAMVNIQELNVNMTNEVNTLRQDRIDSVRDYFSSSSNESAAFPASCLDVRLYETQSGLYTINLPDNKTLRVYCDQTTKFGGWTVIQRRIDGSLYFYRNWTHYKQGFGNLSAEFWIGLDNLYHMTKGQNYTLRIDLTDVNDTSVYAVYRKFHISGPEDNYRLTVGAYSGTAGDSLLFHNNGQFSTYDRDHDTSTQGNCAQIFHGAWWYNSCLNTNLNGRYGLLADDGLWWNTWYRVLKRVEMKIRL